ncbi:hypothetical protein DXB40_07745 [Bacteroides sp. 4_1_36]|nr:hypothetical protein DXB40_07745 [Bacteroides sp. 4_1_36]
MNKNITALNISRIYHHQTLIKNKVLMKIEYSMDRPCPTLQMMIFSFRKQFDEYMMRVYSIIYQYIKYLNYQTSFYHPSSNP